MRLGENVTYALERSMQAGYVSVNQENLLFPAIAVNNAGKGIIAFTLVGPDYFPSAAYAPLSMDSGAGAVRIAAVGTEPADGFSGYRAFADTSVERWGDYHTAVVDTDGSFWFTVQWQLGRPPDLLRQLEHVYRAGEFLNGGLGRIKARTPISNREL